LYTQKNHSILFKQKQQRRPTTKWCFTWHYLHFVITR